MAGKNTLEFLLGAVIAAVLMLTASSAASDSPTDIIDRHLALWQSGDYSRMYDMLSSRSKFLTSRWEFIRAHEKMESQFTIIDFSILEHAINGDEATVRYSLTVKEHFGEQWTERRTARLLKEKGKWRIETDKGGRE